MVLRGNPVEDRGEEAVWRGRVCAVGGTVCCTWYLRDDCCPASFVEFAGALGRGFIGYCVSGWQGGSAYAGVVWSMPVQAG